MSFIQSKLTNLNGNITGILPIANGGTNSSTGTVAERFYIDFINGDDTNGTGSPFAPWKTLQHAYNSTNPTLNVPLIFVLSGGNNDSDIGTITGKPNVTLFAEAPITVTVPLTISGGTSNDNIGFVNIIFNGAVTWIRTDASLMSVFMNGTQFFSGPVLKQTGTGTLAITMQNCLSLNMDVATGGTTSVFLNHTFLGTTTFEDANSSANYQFFAGYSSSAMSISGAPLVQVSGMIADTTAGYTLTCITTANGHPTLQFDSGSVPATITGTFTQRLDSRSQWEDYTPTTSANWNSVPATVLAGLDDLAGSGIVKSQTAKNFLASPNGTSGVPSFRAIVSSDLPTVAIAQGGTGQTTAAAAFAALSPLTTKGDIIYEDATPTPVRLPIGSSGNVLTVSGGVPTWAPPTGGSTATDSVAGLVTSYYPIIKSSVNSVASTNYAILETDGYYAVFVTTGAAQRTITLPTVANSAGRQILIKKVDSGAGTVLISPASTETIDGAASNTITAQYGYVLLESDGANWFVLGAWDLITNSATTVSILVNGTAFTQVTSISLLPGTWTVSGRGYISGYTSMNFLEQAVTATAAASFSPTVARGLSGEWLRIQASIVTDMPLQQSLPSVTVTSATTYFLHQQGDGGSGSGTGNGELWAVRYK